MKYLLSIAIVLFLIFFTACDSDEISDQQAESFIKFYGVAMHDEGIKVLTLTDGYLILANIESPNSGQDICIIRTDKFGNSVQDPLIIGGLFRDKGYAIEPNDEGFVIVGSTRDNDSEYLDVLIAQINASATELIWEIDTGYQHDDEGLDLVIRDNGNIAVCGYSETMDEGSNFLLIERDFQEDTLLISRLNGTVVDEVANTMALAGDQYVLAGWAGLPATSGQPASKRLQVVVWSGGNHVGLPSDLRLPYTVNREVVDIAQAANGDYYLTCNMQNIETGQTEVQLIRTTIDNWSNNNFEDHVVFGERNVNVAKSMILEGNRVYISGTSTTSGTKGDMFIVRANTDGSQAGYYYEGDGESYTGNGFDLTQDGGFIITGASFASSDQSAVAVSKLRE